MVYAMASQTDRKTSGMVFNIQKYSVHDGPGIRTIVFFKGCPLACRWCSNPESQSFARELAFNQGRCLGLSQCVRCLKACGKGAIADQDGMPVFDRSACQGCAMPCVQACPASGVIAYGEVRTVEDVLRVVEQDGAFYSRSGGGLTLSGGEPLAQPEFVLALLREARRRHINTAMESCGYAPWDILRQACENINTLLYDVKCIDSGRHKEFTGRSNGLILENFRKLAAQFPQLPVHARIPVIPGFNDSEDAIREAASFVAQHPKATLELLPYHRLGTQKYHFLSRQAPMGEASLDPELFHRLQSIAGPLQTQRAV